MAGSLKPTILIVDDAEWVLEHAQWKFSDAGYDVLVAGSAADALALLAEKAASIQLVISDYDMPIMNGAALANEINRLYPDLPIIIISGFGRVVSDMPSGVE